MEYLINQMVYFYHIWSQETLGQALSYTCTTWGQKVNWGHLGVKYQTCLYGKITYAILKFSMKDEKESTVTPLCDPWLRGQRSKKVKYQTCLYCKTTYAIL